MSQYIFYCYFLGFFAFLMSIIRTKHKTECKKLAVFTEKYQVSFQLDAPENVYWGLKKF